MEESSSLQKMNEKNCSIELSGWSEQDFKSYFLLPSLVNSNFNNVIIPNSENILLSWIQRYGAGLLPATDIPIGIKIDQSGNIYVAGTSTGYPYGADFAIVKYNASGEIIWTARYNGEDDGNDFITSFEIDQASNIYVTGWSASANSYSDYLIVKYDRDGNFQWKARYNGTLNGKDEATSIAVDKSGNVYVTGFSQGTGSASYDCVTIKYNSSGEEQWVSRYDRTASSIDVATAIVLDSLANVYITGYSYLDSDYNFLIMKYDRSGNEQWVVYKKGYGTGIDIDKLGNIYAIGSTDNDFVTMKYDSEGVFQWIARYNSPGFETFDVAYALAIDDSGYVYVTGKGGYFESCDYLTIKYDTDGNQQWIAEYGSFDYDIANSIAIDDTGNVYVTGISAGRFNPNFPLEAFTDYATVKYNSSGVQQWAVRYTGSANANNEAVGLALDKSGILFVTGYSSDSISYHDFTTIKYNSEGKEQWIACYNGSGNSFDSPVDMMTDDSGNLYITCKCASAYSKITWSASIFDYMTLKYSPDGTQQWVARYNGPGNTNDTPSAIALDKSGNIYVTGTSDGDGTSSDFATIKYNPAGDQLWLVRYNGSDNDVDEAASMVTDKFSNVYVTGRSKNSNTYYDYVTVKYDSDGNEQWIARYSGEGYTGDYPTSIAVDESSNVYVTGFSWVTAGWHDYVTIKYDSSGIEQWSVNYDSPNHSDDRATQVVVDRSGNVYVTGENGFLVKYDSNGNEKWVKNYGGGRLTFLSVDDSGNVYISCRKGSIPDIVTIKFDTYGVEQWIAQYNGPGNSYDAPFNLVLDEMSNVYITGTTRIDPSFNPVLPDYNYITLKYDSDGIEQWSAIYNGPGYSSDVATALAVDKSGNVYVTGYNKSERYPFQTQTISTVKYSRAEVSIKEKNLNIPTQSELFQNYPNPFNQKTNIQYQISDKSNIKLEIYNLMGQKIISFVDQQKPAGIYRVIWDGKSDSGEMMSSGIYLFKLKAGNFVQTRKLIIVR